MPEPTNFSSLSPSFWSWTAITASSPGLNSLVPEIAAVSSGDPVIYRSPAWTGPIAKHASTSAMSPTDLMTYCREYRGGLFHEVILHEPGSGPGRCACLDIVSHGVRIIRHSNCSTNVYREP